MTERDDVIQVSVLVRIKIYNALIKKEYKSKNLSESNNKK